MARDGCCAIREREAKMNDNGATDRPVNLAAVDTFVYRVPIEIPVQTSFGIMYDRPAVVIRLVDTDGWIGWGEVWANFPTVGAEHRARLVDTVLKPLLVNTTINHPAVAFSRLTHETRVLSVQTGEPGPLAQAIAGVDIALWDLFARRAGQPLWRYLGGSAPIVPVYASGINPQAPEIIAGQKFKEGYRAFKLKVGFGQKTDMANLRAMRDLLGESMPIMIDANQAWEVEEAIQLGRALSEYRPFWLEEPILADQPWDSWLELARQCPIPLAGGENLRGMEAFENSVIAGALSVLQPDIGKWGGFTGCLQVATLSQRYGRMFCPHWLGGGIGLVASLHLKAVAGGDGFVEVDANPNPLREWLGHPCPKIINGAMRLTEAPGLGVAPDLPALAEFCTYP
jgi:D-galactarolactone cycloisomerase